MPRNRFIHPNNFILQRFLFPPGHFPPQRMTLSVPLRSVDQVPALPASPVRTFSPRRSVKVLTPPPALRTLPPPTLERATHVADEDEVRVVEVRGPVAKGAFVIGGEVREHVIDMEGLALFDDVGVAFGPFVLR